MIETIPLQTAGAQLPSSLIATAVIALLAGMMVPLRYGMERLAGFARWVVDKLPYQPPPGKSAEQALVDAVEQGDDSPGDSSGQDTTTASDGGGSQNNPRGPPSGGG